MLDIEDKRDIARRLYDEGTTPGHEHCQEAYLDGLWFGLMRGGMDMYEFSQLQEELWEMVDGLIEGEWE